MSASDILTRSSRSMHPSAASPYRASRTGSLARLAACKLSPAPTATRVPESGCHNKMPYSPEWPEEISFSSASSSRVVGDSASPGRCMLRADTGSTSSPAGPSLRETEPPVDSTSAVSGDVSRESPSASSNAVGGISSRCNPSVHPSRASRQTSEALPSTSPIASEQTKIQRPERDKPARSDLTHSRYPIIPRNTSADGVRPRRRRSIVGKINSPSPALHGPPGAGVGFNQDLSQKLRGFN